MCVYSRHTLCVFRCIVYIHTFVHHIFLIQVYRQYEFLATPSGFLDTFLAKSSSKADLEQSCGSSARRERQRRNRRFAASRFPAKRPVPLPLGAPSTQTVGKLLFFLHRYFSYCPQLLQPTSSDGSFAKCPPWGLQWGFQHLQTSCHPVWGGLCLSPRLLRCHSMVAFSSVSGCSAGTWFPGTRGWWWFGGQETPRANAEKLAFVDP